MTLIDLTEADDGVVFAVRRVLYVITAACTVPFHENNLLKKLSASTSPPARACRCYFPHIRMPSYCPVKKR
jgi:hypothetical protein